MTNQNDELTQTRLKELLDYNPETGIFTWKVSSAKNVKVGDEAGYKRPNGYICISIDGKQYFANRLVWLFVHGCFPKGNLYYIDQIRDNNRIKNLREATQSQNMINSKTQSNNTSGIRGVYYYKPTQKWYASIGVLGKRLSLGYYENKFDAAKDRFKAEIKYGYTDILSMASNAHIYILLHGSEEDLYECYLPQDSLNYLEEVNFEKFLIYQSNIVAF